MTGLRLTSYVTSKLVVLGVMRLNQSFLFVTVFALMVRIPDSELLPFPYVEFMIIPFLIMVSVVISMGIFVSPFFKNSDRVMMAAPILFFSLVFKLEDYCGKYLYLQLVDGLWKGMVRFLILIS